VFSQRGSSIDHRETIFPNLLSSFPGFPKILRSLLSAPAFFSSAMAFLRSCFFGVLSLALVFSLPLRSVLPLHLGVGSLLEVYVDGVSWVLLSLSLVVGLSLVCFASSAFVLVFSFAVSLVSVFLFVSGHALLWFVVFEIVLVPMLLWGLSYGGFRSFKASLYLVGYTAVSGSVLLVGLVLLFVSSGSWSLSVWVSSPLPSSVGVVAFLLVFLGLAVKVPLFPFYGWLPEAHVEASTEGSVILAALLLKFGCFGMIRLCLDVLGPFAFFWFPLVQTVCVLGAVLSLVSALVATDMKRVVAYSSVGHMGVMTLGLFSGDRVGESGAVFEMVSHGVVASLLFLCVGILSRRIGSRQLLDVSGAMSVSPVLGSFVALSFFGNMAAPGLSSFVGELLVLAGLGSASLYVSLAWSAITLVLNAAISIRVVSAVLFGNPGHGVWYDVRTAEALVLLPFAWLMVSLGLVPDLLLDLLRCG
jgi:NADH-quinone oxidoreductase subunit M